MKKLIVATMLLTPSWAFADPPIPPVELVEPIDAPSIKEPSKKQKSFDYYCKLSDEFTHKRHYQHLVFKDRQTKKVKKFSELAKEKQLYYMFFMGEKLALYLEMVYDSWTNDFKTLKNDLKTLKKKPDENIAKIKELEAEIAEVNPLIKELIALRIKTATRFENFIRKAIDDLKLKNRSALSVLSNTPKISSNRVSSDLAPLPTTDYASEEELNTYLNSVKSYHNNHKLVKRK